MDDLTEREKETLRLLLAGHDAKSIARNKNLSVHTINERLRDARRKLGVTSSREAARMLAGAERQAPNFLADKELGVGSAAAGMLEPGGRRSLPSRGDFRLVWLGGGMLIMSILVAAAVLIPAIYSPGAASRQEIAASPQGTQGEAQARSASAARAWAALLDSRRWNDSWREAATLFKSQITADNWAATISGLRDPLGKVSSRRFLNVRKAATLPGAPAGDYELIEFETNFARKSGAVETIVLAREGPGWKVAGYFIR